jgi:hypothetical protein
MNLLNHLLYYLLCGQHLTVNLSVAFSAQHVKELVAQHYGQMFEAVRLTFKTLSGIPERRCSSRTFRYGYLVTT